MYKALSQAMVGAICGPPQVRLDYTCNDKELKKRCLKAISWIAWNRRPSVILTSAEGFVNFVTSKPFGKVTTHGALGQYLSSRYWSRDMDPRFNNDLGMAVNMVVGESRWPAKLRHIVAEIAFAGIRFFPYAWQDWENMTSCENPPKPSVRTAGQWRTMFELMAEGVVPVLMYDANKRGELLVVSPYHNGG